MSLQRDRRHGSESQPGAPPGGDVRGRERRSPLAAAVAGSPIAVSSHFRHRSPGVNLSPAWASNVECPPAAGAMSHERADHVEERLVARPHAGHVTDVARWSNGNGTPRSEFSRLRFAPAGRSRPCRRNSIPRSRPAASVAPPDATLMSINDKRRRLIHQAILNERCAGPAIRESTAAEICRDLAGSQREALDRQVATRRARVKARRRACVPAVV